jgi:DNA-binding MarR family transcriptional regulator
MKDVIDKVREFNRFYTGIIGVMNNHILESDYSLSEVRVMFEIYHHPNITARQIKEIIELDEGYLSRLVNKLVKQKVITRVKSKEDNRVSALTLSKKGKDIFLRLNQRSSNDVSAILQHLSKSQQEELLRLLEKVKALLTVNK